MIDDATPEASAPGVNGRREGADAGCEGNRTEALTDREGPARYKSRETWDFTGIREIGFRRGGVFIVSAWTTPAVAPGERRGSFFTSIPISPLSYRRVRQTKCAYARDWGRLTIWDDWGTPYIIEAADDIIDALVAECIAQQVPPRPLAAQTAAVAPVATAPQGAESYEAVSPSVNNTGAESGDGGTGE